MTKKVFLIVLGAVFALTLNAQVRFGVKAGWTLSDWSWTETRTYKPQYEGQEKETYQSQENAGSKIGLQLGGLLEYPFSKSFALQPELSYVLNRSGNANEYCSLHNIQLLVNLKREFKSGDLTVFATAGPYVSYIVDAHSREYYEHYDKEAGEYKYEFRTVNLFDDIKDEDGTIISKSKWGHFDGGIGVGFGVEINKIIISTGYQFGLANVHYDKEDNKYMTSENKMKIGILNHFTVGYSF